MVAFAAAKELIAVIKLTRHQAGERGAVIRVEGRLNAEGVEQLQSLIAPDSQIDPPALDITGLTSVDAVGRECLVSLRQSGARLIGGSLYINRLLEEAQS